MAIVTNTDPEKAASKVVKSEFQERAKALVQPYSTTATPLDKIDQRILGYFTTGSSWEVTYYRQLLGADDEPKSLSLEQDAVYQQYARIRKFIIKVSTQVSDQQDPKTLIFTNSGDGAIMAAFGPNVGDMFVADAGDGKPGLFTITNVERINIYTYSTYRITYQMRIWMDKEYQANLDRKTVYDYVFDPNGWLNGSGPFVTNAEQTLIDACWTKLPLMIDDYFSDFFSHDKASFMVPDQDAATYDHFLTKFLVRLLDTTWAPRLLNVSVYNLSSDHLLSDSTTVWDALIERRDHYLRTGIQRAQRGTIERLRGRPEFNVAVYSGIKFMVTPIEHSTNIDDQARYRDISLRWYAPFCAGQVRRRANWDDTHPADPKTRNEYQANTEARSPTGKLPLIHPVTIDDGYVLSKAFYTNTEGRSQLEVLVDTLVNRKPIDATVVTRLIDDCMNWTNLERFYYQPILMFTMLLYIRRLNNVT